MPSTTELGVKIDRKRVPERFCAPDAGHAQSAFRSATLSVDIRTATAADLPQVAAVIREAYEDFRPVFSSEHFAHRIERWTEVEKPFSEAQILVTTRAERITGVVMFYPEGGLSRQGEWPPGWSGMVRLSVRPEARRSGIAKALTLECIRRSREHGVRTLGLHTTDWMPVAKAMYERMGFVRDTTFDFAIQAGIAQGYRLDLNPTSS